MKHFLWVACLLLLAVPSLQAQDTEHTMEESPNASIYARKSVLEQDYKRIYYGGRIGVTLSSLGGDADSTSNKVGLMIGLFAGTNLNSQLAVQVGLQYLKKGSKIDSDSLWIGVDAPSGLTLNATYDYLAIPITVRYFPWENNGFFLEGGFQTGLLLKSELVGLDGDFDTDDVNGRIDVKDDLNSLDFAPRIGLGYEWREALEFALAYQYGLANTLSNGDMKVNNKLWQITIGYRL